MFCDETEAVSGVKVGGAIVRKRLRYESGNTKGRWDSMKLFEYKLNIIGQCSVITDIPVFNH